MKHGLIIIALTLLYPLTGAGQTGEASAGDRLHRSAEGYTRDFGERGSATTGQLKEQTLLAADKLSRPRTTVRAAGVSNAWIFDADAELFDDLDADGYFRFLSVRLDADTYLAGMYVYAMLYLSSDGEVWEHYYTTQDFFIDGTVADDEYFVETDLLEGFPPGLYDVLIELYDADFATFEDEFGPEKTSALSLLPIEDASYDVPPIQVVVTDGGGGAASPGMLALLLVAGLARVLARRSRQNPRRQIRNKEESGQPAADFEVLRS